MPLIVRLGDSSTHGGRVVTSAARWSAEGKKIARKGDMFDCPIHGLNPIVEGSSKWLCEGAEIAREGDHTACGAALISGAERWSCD
ncbi:PAAR domain-containing protein [Afifella pfennigii]|uniref:PAAR domain-containing protein n=1 Tax=Afifella pfennigii TaxID=209897 RepID=UPI00047BEFF0|nr:PAAR domain-containing protein [Afifella pfennigii]